MEVIDIPPPFEYHSFLEETRWDALLQEDRDLQRPSSNALTLLARVSKHWNSTATPILYQKIKLHTDRQISIAASTLEHRHTNPSPWLGMSHGSFVKTLSMGNLYCITEDPSVVSKMQTVIAHSPNLQSYRTALFHNMPNLAGSINYSTRLVRNLISNGRHITVLHLSDSKLRMPDLTSLVKGLPTLEVLIISTMLLWEMESTRARVKSCSLKSLVINEPEGAAITLGQFRSILNAIASWVLPALHSVLIHDCCYLEFALKSVAVFLAAHGGNLRRMAFRSEVKPFSDRELLLLKEQFLGFRYIGSSSSFVQFSK